MAVRAGRMTYTDLESLPEDGKKYELHEGEVFVTAAPRTDHQILLQNLEDILLHYVRENKLGFVLLGVDVYFAEDTVYNPDVCFVGRESVSRIEEKFVKGAPDIMIEILSPSTAARDRGVKLQDYARYGVREYWIFDAKKRSAEVYVLRGSAFGLRERLSEAGELTSEVLPDLRIPLSQVWPEPFGKTD
jgi:Uma2 family endonuclease